MILQPIVENSISHGLETKIGETEISISFLTSTKRLIIQVTDNGTGIPLEDLSLLQHRLANSTDIYEKAEQIPSSSTGIGLFNVQKRIRHRFGNLYGISIASAKGFGTEVIITLPIILTLNEIED